MSIGVWNLITGVGIFIVSALTLGTVIWLNSPRLSIHSSLLEVRDIDRKNDIVRLILKVDFHSTQGGSYPIDTVSLVASDQDGEEIEKRSLDQIPKAPQGNHEVPNVVSPSAPFSEKVVWRVNRAVTKVRVEVEHYQPRHLRTWVGKIVFDADKLVTSTSKWIDVSDEIYVAELAKEEVENIGRDNL